MLQEILRDRFPNVGFDLFCVFARFEYAMKRGGFRRANAPEAAWTTFAQSLPDEFCENAAATGGVSILFDEPPRALVMTADGGAEWDANPVRPTNNAELFDAVKRVRNNLFHGDKQYDVARDTELVQAALLVLNLAYDSVENDPTFLRFVSEFRYE